MTDSKPQPDSGGTARDQIGNEDTDTGSRLVPQTTSHRILVAEDDRINLKLISSIIKKMGHQVIECADGNAALEHLMSDNGPTLAVLDWMMPGPSGVELCENVRTSGRSSYVYLLLVTGRSEDADLVKGLQAGADDYLMKPIKRDILQARIESGIRIIERENYLKQLADSHDNILRAVPSILVAINTQDTITDWNGVAESFFGVARDQAVGRSILEVGLKWDWEVALEALVYAQDHLCKQTIEELQITCADGELRFFHCIFSPITDSHNRVAGMLFLLTDITEQKKLQEQLSQSRRLEAIGELAAGIAHEINTPSQFVSDNLEFLEEGFADILQICSRQNSMLVDGQALKETEIHELKELMDVVDYEYLCEEIPKAIAGGRSGIKEVTRIVRATNEFAHPGSEDLIETDLNSAIENILVVSKNRWKMAAEVETLFDENLPAVPCHPEQLNQVLINIVVNAAHAIDARDQDGMGTIKISTGQTGDMAKIVISDNGTGIPREHLEKIFNPFFTTKPPGKGTGQGLAIAHRIITEVHHGTLQVDSTVGEGTTFHIQLPLQHQSANDAESKTQSEEHTHG